jgi:hypothetical protein
MSTGGKHGDSWAWTLPDGTRMSRESLNLRGQVWEIDTSVASGTDGMPARLVVRGVTPQGDAAEIFTIAGGQATWQSPVDKGATAYAALTPAPISIEEWQKKRDLKNCARKF